MSLLQLPSTSKGLLIAIGAIAIIVVFAYATTLLTVALGALIIAVALYVLWVIGVRLHRIATDWSPWRRSA